MNTHPIKHTGLQGSQAQELLSLWSWGVPASQHKRVLANWDAHQISLVKSLCTAQSLATTHFLRDEWVGLTVPTLPQLGLSENSPIGGC